MAFRYWLEVERGGVLDRAIELPLISAVTSQRQAATTVTWTLGELPVLERSGLREARFTLSGSSGLETRRGHTRSGSTTVDSGPALFREFEVFLEGYDREASVADGLAPDLQSGRPSPKVVRMIFRAENESRHFYVEPLAFVWNRDTAGNRFTYSWRLDLLAYAPASSRREIAPTTDPTRPEARQRQLRLSVDLAANAIGWMRSYIRSTDRFMRQFLSPIRATLLATNELRLAAEDIRRLAGLPRDALVQAAFALEQAELAIHEILTSADAVTLERLRPHAERLLQQVTPLRLALISALGGFGIPLALATPRPGPGSVATGANRDLVRTTTAALSSYTLHQGETLEDVASKVLGDETRWPEIALLNGFSSPVSGEAGAPLTGGMEILVPEGEGSLPVIDPTEILGETLALTKDRDLVLDGTTVRTVRGVQCLVQDLRERVLHVQGDFAAWPDLGLPVRPGDPSSLVDRGTLAAKIRVLLMDDRRVKSVDRLDLVDGGDRWRVDSTVTVAGGGKIDLALPVG